MMYSKLILFLVLLILKQNESYDQLLQSGYMTGKVVGGLSVPISMYPHVARLIMGGFVICGGSIIRDRIVITAAHCLVIPGTTLMMPATQMTIGVGSADPTGGVMHRICKLVPHPKYVSTNIVYDIGLISVKNPFKLGPLVQKIPIVNHEQWKNEKYTFTLAGFGATLTQGQGVPITLLATRMHYVNSDVCRRSQTTIGIILPVQEYNFCLVGSKWSSDCYGDSGSGIVWRNQLVGLVSTGLDAYCGSDVTPSMYTNVYHFNKWINTESEKLENKTSCSWI